MKYRLKISLIFCFLFLSSFLKADQSINSVESDKHSSTSLTSKQILLQDNIKILLSWKNPKQDLDAKLLTVDNTVNGNSKIDEAKETIQLRHRFYQDYVYVITYVDYRTEKEKYDLAKSSAEVRIYVKDKLVKSYCIDKNSIGKTWVVFKIRKNGFIQDINEYIFKFKKVGIYGDIHYVKDKYLHVNRSISFQDSKKSQQCNDKGEVFYHQKKLKKALAYFQKAIEYNNKNAQAYTNLGLVYHKLGMDIDAIWANQKAINIAQKVDDEHIQAVAYYNLSDIYTSHHDDAKALQSFKKALLYTDGLKRLQKQLYGKKSSDATILGKTLFSSCATCHGKKGELKALGKSKIINKMSQQNIFKALKGYKEGKYGGEFKGIMRVKVRELNDEELKSLAEYIVTLK